jgi:hypothetical protein
LNDSLDLDRLARCFDAAAGAYYRDTSAETGLAFHAAKSALLAAVAREPGRRWWRGSTCYEATPTGLLTWSAPAARRLPPRRPPNRPGVRFFSGPGIVPRAGRSLGPTRPPRERRIA